MGKKDTWKKQTRQGEENIEKKKKAYHSSQG